MRVGIDRESHTSAELSAENYRWLKIRRGKTDESLKSMLNRAVSEFREREEAKERAEAAP